MQGFIKHSGQRCLTYDASNASKVAGGDTVEELELTLADCRRGVQTMLSLHASSSTILRLSLSNAAE